MEMSIKEYPLSTFKSNRQSLQSILTGLELVCGTYQATSVRSLWQPTLSLVSVIW